jgi:hypothetical protein
VSILEWIGAASLLGVIIVAVTVTVEKIERSKRVPPMPSKWRGVNQAKPEIPATTGRGEKLR